MQNTVEPQVVHFKVEGSFITDIARSWFFLEGKPYEKAEELLLNCLINDSISDERRKELVKDILEGRYKLVGINEFSLEEDGKEIRSVDEWLIKMERKKGIDSIERDMIKNPMTYIDEFAIKSLITKDMFDSVGLEFCYENIISYLEGEIFIYYDSYDYNYSEEDYEERKEEYFEKKNCSYTKNGLWLIQNPELVYDICKGVPPTKDVFNKLVYEYIEKTLQPLSVELLVRQSKYKGFMENKEENKGSFVDGMINQKNLIKEFDWSELSKKRTREMTKDEYIYYCFMTFDLDCVPYIDNSLPLLSGIIDKKGNFYPCRFASHNIIARHILFMNREEFGLEDDDREIRMLTDTAIDKLIKYGYIFIRGIHDRDYLTYDASCNFSKEQMKTLFKLISKFNIVDLKGLDDMFGYCEK